MKNEVVFVTGAAGAIGFDIARQFAENAATVVMSDIDSKKLEEATATISRRDLKVFSIKVDVTDENQVKAAFNETYKTYGGIDILVNNAGLQHVALIEDCPTDKFELLIKVMLVGSFISTKHVFPIMKAQKFGRIINIASVNGSLVLHVRRHTTVQSMALSDLPK